MEAKEYQRLAMRTNDGLCNKRLTHEIIHKGKLGYADIGEVINASLGLSGEVGELNDMIKKSIFHGHSFDIGEVEKEIGDIAWYLVMMCHGLGLDFDEVLQSNIDKLKKRYPDGFSEQASINREE